MFGIVVCLLLVLEGAYRLQGYVRRLGVVPDTVARESGSDWMPAYLREHKTAIEAIRWQPFVYYRAQPHGGTYINVDASGHRRTVQSGLTEDAPSVLMFGGSTLFGSFQRDDWTLPSRLAKRFDACSGTRVRFVNFGVSGRVFTQEVIELLLQLRGGALPRVVVFYDGINDVAAAVQNDRPGWPQNEGNRSRDFEFGRRTFWWEADARAELRAFTYLAVAGLSRLQFLQRLQPFSVPGPLPPPIGEASAQALVESYSGTVRVVEGLSREFGFVPLYVWQPTIHSTGKTLTPAESAIFAELRQSGFGQKMIALHRGVAGMLEKPVRALPPERFVSLSTVLDGQRGPMFTDGIGHTYEGANEILADALAPHVARALRQAGVEAGCSPQQ